MARKPTLLNAVLENVRNARQGSRSWFDRLPPDSQSELEAVRQGFDPAIHQKRAYARAVIHAANENGIEIAGEKQVIAWLEGRH